MNLLSFSEIRRERCRGTYSMDTVENRVTNRQELFGLVRGQTAIWYRRHTGER